MQDQPCDITITWQDAGSQHYDLTVVRAQTLGSRAGEPGLGKSSWAPWCALWWEPSQGWEPCWDSLHCWVTLLYHPTASVSISTKRGQRHGALADYACALAAHKYAGFMGLMTQQVRLCDPCEGPDLMTSRLKAAMVLDNFLYRYIYIDCPFSVFYI